MVELIIDWILKRGSKFSGQGVGGTKATPGQGVSVSQGRKHQTNLAGGWSITGVQGAGEGVAGLRLPG